MERPTVAIKAPKLRDAGYVYAPYVPVMVSDYIGGPMRELEVEGDSEPTTLPIDMFVWDPDNCTSTTLSGTHTRRGPWPLSHDPEVDYFVAARDKDILPYIPSQLAPTLKQHQEDIEYFRKKLFESMGIPAKYMLTEKQLILATDRAKYTCDDKDV